MTKKEYIEKLENLILQRVKYHAPNLNTLEIDYSLLDVVGIDKSYPIFLFKKPMNKVYLKAFENAKNKVDFNLILLEKPLFNSKKLEKLEKTYLILKDEMGSNLYNTLDGLNINYITHSNFKNDVEGEYIKVNDQKLNFNYLPYYNTKKFANDGVIFDVKQFLLNGKNCLVNIINTRKEIKSAKVELNIPLPRGYYFFNRGCDFIEIQNLTTKEKAYFNFNIKNANVVFSNMSGIESCTFSVVNLTSEIKLLPGQKVSLFFNFGEKKTCIYNFKSIENFFNLSQIKMNEIFDVKVSSRDINFDNQFNRCLPQKIWEKWQKGEVYEEGINSWLKIKEKLIKSTEKGCQILSENKNIKEVRFFRNSQWKRVFLLHNNSNYMYANKVKYYNYNLLTKEIFEKNNEIYLSFAD